MKQICACTLAALGAALAGCGGGSSSDEGPAPLTVTKAQCGSADRPETGLQGQVPAALRSAGFGGFSCNLELVGQNRGDGGNWQATQFRDKSGHKCAYHGTAFTTAGRTQTGVRVLDVTTPANPTYLASLTTPSMMDPWESLKVNERRQLLAADNGRNGAGGPEIDLYDLSGDCRTPQLLSSVAVGKDDGSGGAVAPIIGHEGSWSPDGLTYYGGGRTVPNNYYVIDTTSTTKPKLMMTWLPPKSASGGRTHGLSISEDGNRAYFTQIGAGNVDPAVAPVNGLVIADVSDIQSRKANPQIRVVSELYWKDGSTAQHTIAVKIGGKPYIIFVDEAGSAGTTTPATVKAACDANMTPFPMARIIDIADEKSPKVISKLMLETHDPKNCDKILPDMAGLAIFTYGSHYCSVDNRLNATTLACGYFNSGIRIFDIRNPERPREIAYYNPAGVEVPSTGSNHTQFGGTAAVGGRKPDWCSAQVHLDASNGTLWTTCQDNGVLVLRFTNGVWPFPESTTPAGLQN
jgi:hypothetical protein